MEEEEEGEDLLENALKDYQPIAALDTYGREGIDDREFGDIDYDDRYAAEAVLAERDRERARLMRGEGRGGRASGFYGALEELVEGMEEEVRSLCRTNALRRIICLCFFFFLLCN